MKKKWILWNALKEPESIIKDERMEQIQWKSYYWCYRTLIRILIFLMIFWPMILDLLKKYLGESLIGEMFFQLLTFGIISVMETGRFLYSCYYGNQEFYEKGKGKWNFWSCSLSMGAFPWLMFFIFCGAKHPLPWVMAVLGILLAVFLSHLAYLHYALLIDEETGEKGRRSEAWIPAVCAVILAVYYGAIFVTGLLSQIPTSLTKEEQQMIQEVQRGIDNYHCLENYKMDYTFQTDIESEVIDLPHANYLVSQGECYTQVLDPENEDTVYREYYRKDPDTLEWYMADQGKWISEEEWLQAYTEEWTTDMLDHTFHNTQPICGLLDVTPKTVEVITKEYQDGKTCYTIIYNNKYKQVAGSLENSDEIKEAKATESYTINEYGVLTEYERIETGTIKATGGPCTMHRSFTIQSANREAIQSEINNLKKQYLY